jgi:hypothetical protein
MDLVMHMQPTKHALYVCFLSLAEQPSPLSNARTISASSAIRQSHC